MNEKKKSFWTSLKGIITLIISAIAALGGLIGGLNAVGIIGGGTIEGGETVGITINVEGNGTTNPIPGRHVYKEGTPISITALPDSGCEFKGWTGDFSGTSPTLSITMDRNIAITAQFVAITLRRTLTISVSGQGTTSPKPGTYTYDDDELAEIIATPSSGYSFDYWEGDASGNDSSITIIMDSDKSVTAHFKQILIDTTPPEPKTSQVEAILDQSNEPPWLGGWYLINPENKTSQSFVPTYPILVAVEVSVTTANEIFGDDTIVMKVLGDDEQILASSSQFVLKGFDGWLRFDIQGGGINVTPGERLFILLEGIDAKYTFGWKSNEDNYYLFGNGWCEKLFRGGVWHTCDFYFRTYGSPGGS